MKDILTMPFMTLILCLILTACHATPLFWEEEFRHVMNDLIDEEERAGHNDHVEHLTQLKQDHLDHLEKEH